MKTSSPNSLERSEHDCLFQQDGAPVLAAKEMLEFLCEFFGGDWFQKDYDHPEVRIYHLVTSFFGVTSRIAVVQNEIPTIKELKRHITMEINLQGDSFKMSQTSGVCAV